VVHPGSAGSVDWKPDQALLDAVSIATLAVDRNGVVVAVNQYAAGHLGADEAALLGAPLTAILFADSEHGAAGEVLRQALGGTRWTGELPVRGRDDIVSPAALSFSPVIAGGEVVGALLHIEDGTTSRTRSRRLSERLARLARVTAELLFAEHVDAVTKIVINHMADAAGATVASLSMLVDDDTLVLVGLRGGLEGAAARWATYPVAADTPAGETVRTGRALVMTGRSEIRGRYPELESAAEGERSMVCLPLRIGTRVIGVVTMSFPGRRTFDSAEMEFFHLLADTCAQALDRMQAVETASLEAAKLQFLADASAELSGSLDYQATLRNIADLAVPQWADWCAISLAEDGVLHTLAVAHSDPDKVALAEEYQRRYPPDPESGGGAYQVLRTGRSELVSEIPDEMLTAAASEPEQLQMLRDLDFASALLVPLRLNDKVVGVLTWVSGPDRRRFGPADQVFAEELASRAAVAIENSQLHSELREVADRLQRVVMPPPLPEIEGWELAAHYQSAGHTDVGGDFYDIVALDEDRLALFVGDVMGRGVQAVTAMAQMRSAVRTLVGVEPEPQWVLRRLDTLFARYDLDQLVTMVYVVIDRRRDTVTIANAGHPAPVIIRSDGDVEQLGLQGDLLLGIGDSARSTVTVPFRVGDTLLTYTDGLIERHSEDIDAGQQRLLERSRSLAHGDLAGELRAVVADVRDPERDDDIAAVAMRRHQPG
jgi:serine phosphatase RsbU (regulator of sigma subunit)